MNNTALLYVKLETFETARLALARIIEDSNKCTGISAEVYHRVAADAYATNGNAYDALVNTARLISNRAYMDVSTMVDRLCLRLLELDAGKITQQQYGESVAAFVNIITGRE